MSGGSAKCFHSSMGPEPPRMTPCSHSKRYFIWIRSATEALMTPRIPFLAAIAGLALSLHAQQTPPSTWVDKDTGHRVFRLADQGRSSGFYFNLNAYYP